MYAANFRISPSTRMLLERARRVLDTVSEDGCVLTDDELLGQGLALLLQSMDVSAHVNAGMLVGVEAEPV